MKVSLSASVLQLRCMLYSSSRVRGSEAVASRISCSFQVISGYTCLRDQAEKFQEACSGQDCLLGLASIHDTSVHDACSTGQEELLRYI